MARKIDMRKQVLAMNVVQNTRLAANRDVLEAIDYVIERELDTEDFPAIRELPDFNNKEDWQDEDKRRQMNRDRSHVHAHNNKAQGRRLAMLRIESLARRYDEGFHLPTYADHRGRIYYRPPYLNPQGQDAARGLIEFYDGIPIASDEAVQALYLSVAGACGHDKGTLNDRHLWVDENYDRLVRYGTDWRADLGWLHEFDTPWQALRACIELAQFDGVGLGFNSRLVSYADGKCNGLQNFGALTLDPETCDSVSLNSVPEPADIYSVVRDKAVDAARAVEIWNKDHTLAQTVVRNGIPRSWAKIVTLVMPYSGTRYGTNDVVHNSLHADVAAGQLPPYPDLRIYARYVNGLLWDALEDTVRKPVEVQQWFRKVATLAVDVNQPLSYVTPTGLPVKLEEWSSEPYRITTTFNGSIFTPTLRRQTDSLNPTRMKNSISPNVIHSLDSSMLVDTVVRGSTMDEPIRDWVTIHDSFGVHVADRPTLLAPDGPLKSAFVEQYAGDFLAELAETWSDQLGCEIPQPPARGSFNLDEVRHSDYFFS